MYALNSLPCMVKYFNTGEYLNDINREQEQYTIHCLANIFKKFWSRMTSQMDISQLASFISINESLEETFQSILCRIHDESQSEKSITNTFLKQSNNQRYYLKWDATVLTSLSVDDFKIEKCDINTIVILVDYGNFKGNEVSFKNSISQTHQTFQLVSAIYYEKSKCKYI